jgi:hypothetical protein
MVLKPIKALLIAGALSLAMVEAAAAGGLGLNVGPMFSPKTSAALGNALAVRPSDKSASTVDSNGPDGAHVELGCIDAARFPDFVNVPPTPCPNGKWPGS